MLGINKIKEIINPTQKHNGYMSEALLQVVLETLKANDGNVLFLFYPHSYESYPDSRDNTLSPLLRAYLGKFNVNHYPDGMDTTSPTIMENIRARLNENQDQDGVDRVAISVFTKSKEEVKVLAAKCLALENVAVYIM